MKRVIAAILSIISILLIVCTAYAGTLSDPVFDSATTTLTSIKKASFSVETSSPQASISITSVELYVMSGGAWTYVCNLPAPTKVGTNTKTFSATMDYSSYIGTGTYRLYTTFCADGYSISRYSNTRTY